MKPWSTARAVHPRGHKQMETHVNFERRRQMPRFIGQFELPPIEPFGHVIRA